MSIYCQNVRSQTKSIKIGMTANISLEKQNTKSMMLMFLAVFKKESEFTSQTCFAAHVSSHLFLGRKAD